VIHRASLVVSFADRKAALMTWSPCLVRRRDPSQHGDLTRLREAGVALEAVRVDPRLPAPDQRLAGRGVHAASDLIDADAAGQASAAQVTELIAAQEVTA